MSIFELHRKLQELGISEDRYYLHGLYGSTDDNDKPALTIRKGNYSMEYEVYYIEKGEKHSIRIFTTEDEACKYFYKRLKDDKEIGNVSN